MQYVYKLCVSREQFKKKTLILAIEQSFETIFFSKTAPFSDFTDSVCIVKHIIRINKLGMSYIFVNFRAPTIQLFIAYKVKFSWW